MAVLWSVAVIVALVVWFRRKALALREVEPGLVNAVQKMPGASENETATLHLERVSGGWVDSMRAYEVIVNEEKRAELRPGDKGSIEAEAGQIEIYLRLDSGRSRSIALTMEPDAEARLRCRPRRALTALYGATLGRNNYMQLEVAP